MTRRAPLVEHGASTGNTKIPYFCTHRVSLRGIAALLTMIVQAQKCGNRGGQVTNLSSHYFLDWRDIEKIFAASTHSVTRSFCFSTWKRGSCCCCTTRTSSCDKRKRHRENVILDGSTRATAVYVSSKTARHSCRPSRSSTSTVRTARPTSVLTAWPQR